MRGRRGSPVGDIIRGAIAGGVATWLMDQVTTRMLESQPAEVTAREEAARPSGCVSGRYVPGRHKRSTARLRQS